MGNHLPTLRRKINIEGFIIDSSQNTLAKWIFKTYPETTIKVRSQNPQLRTTYMNVLFGIIKTIYHRPLRDLTEEELNKALKDLCDLTEAGFDLDWLKSYVVKASLGKKSPETRVLEINEEVKILAKVMYDLEVEKKIEKKKPSWISKSDEINGEFALHVSF